MTTVYVVTTGDYEDVELAAIFSDKGVAEQFTSILDQHEKAEVIEYELDQFAAYVQRGLRPYWLRTYYNGTIEDSRAHDYAEPPTLLILAGTGETALQGTVWAVNKEQAEEMISSLREELIADGEWKVLPVRQK